MVDICYRRNTTVASKVMNFVVTLLRKLVARSGNFVSLLQTGGAGKCNRKRNINIQAETLAAIALQTGGVGAVTLLRRRVHGTRVRRGELVAFLWWRKSKNLFVLNLCNTVTRPFLWGISGLHNSPM